MKTLIKFCFRILWWMTFVAVALLFVGLAYRNWIAAQMAEREIRNSLGLEADIGDLSFGVTEPTLTFTNLKLYNSTQFGGTLLADLPELHLEYDRSALRHHELHITLMRVNLNELDVVENGEGATNIFVLANTLFAAKPHGAGRQFAPLNGRWLSGIDTLNISIGTVKFVDLKDQKRNRSLSLHLQNLVLSNVKSPDDLAGLESQIWSAGGYLVGLPQGPQKRPALAIGAGALKAP